MAGPVRISSGVSSGADSDGTGNISATAEIPASNASGLAALEDLLAHPELYYLNLHTSDHPAGAIRAQLQSHPSTFAQVARGGGISSTFNLVNSSTTSSVDGTVHFVGDDGKPAAFPEGPLRFTLAPGASRALSTSALGGVLGGYARLTSSGSVTSTITFTLPGFGSATAGPTGTYRSFSGAVSRNVPTGRTTGIALVNAHEVPIRVELILLDAGGVVAAGRLVELEARGHVARTVEEFFPEISSTFEGTLLAIARRGFFSIRALGGLMIRVAPGEFAEAPITGVP